MIKLLAGVNWDEKGVEVGRPQEEWKKVARLSERISMNSRGDIDDRE